MGFLDSLFTWKKSKNPEKMMAKAITLFNSTMQKMRDLQTDEPTPRIWAKVISDLSEVIDTGQYKERALYLRARAHYHGGHYVEAVKDLDTFFGEGHRYDASVHGDLSPRTLRGMAKVELKEYKEAEADLQEEIRELGVSLDELSVCRSRTYYWLLVCEHDGDRSAARDEQSEYF